ncbi:TonB-dependent receptor [Sphingobium jiangsuense]|uniref:Iron complex outermembrane receptor protein n=1 Tax=Sphingobium jiangsuense TaxID=870476 RepID=A0A7W6FPP0_9SPHN|nr:TonB-dependent receptor [Sphingobium jiangsuense]MBB3926083.1 iron complex outermembrane receptor protein [Sphingobium jiangsuense]GLS99202.1 TonB-dependent receptor [Sphingobium jiangsuense]
MKYLLLGTSALMLVSSAAFAQTAGGGAGAAANSGESAGINEIIVTAERRAQSAQDVPVSIVAISGNTLRERGVDDLDDLQAEVPSLSFVDNGNSKFVNIRGVGLTEAAPNQTIAVAVHLDGAYIAREFTFNDAFFDLAGIEVLRGPQGTYSGQNASGGAIFINSARPDLQETTGYAELTLAEYNRKQISGAISVPLSDKVAVRVALQNERRDSFYTNFGPTGQTDANLVQSQPGNVERFLGRAQVLAKPTDRLELRLIHQFSNVESDGVARNAYNAANLARPFIINYDSTDTLQRVEYNRTTGIVAWDATDAFRVNANFAYQKTRNDQRIDSDRTSVLVEPTVRQEYSVYDIRDRYYTGEFNLISTGEGPFEWTVGATMLDYRQKAYLWTPKGPQIAAGTGTYLFLDAYRKNWAVFGEVGYRLTDTIEVKVGGRYNHEKNGFHPESYRTSGGPDAAPASYFIVPEQTFKNFTGRALVNWKPDSSTLVYATVSKGYKPGGAAPGGDEYGSETVVNYELGWKADWLGRALQTSISAFYMDYDGFQASIATDPDNPTTRVTSNIDNTRIKGVEAQISTNIGGFHGDLSFSVLDAKYGSLTVFMPVGGFNNTAPLPVNLGGRQINYAPEFSLSGGLAYDIPLGGGELTPSVRLSHTGKQWASFFQLPYHEIPKRTLVDLRLTYAADSNWKLAAFVTNVFDKTYINVASTAVDGVGAYGLGAPRQFGGTLSYTF